MRFDSCGECNVVFRAEMRPQARKEGPVAGSDSVAGEAMVEGSFAVLLSGLADGGEFDDSLADWRDHTVTARCNRDVGLDVGLCHFGEQCVELLASALPSERGSEMTRGLLTALCDSARELDMGKPARGRMEGLRGGDLNEAARFHTPRGDRRLWCAPRRFAPESSHV
jgi:hypothetical protein